MEETPACLMASTKPEAEAREEEQKGRKRSVKMSYEERGTGWEKALLYRQMEVV